MSSTSGIPLLDATLGKRWQLAEFHETTYCPDVIRTLLVETLQVGWVSIPSEGMAFANGVKRRLLEAADAARAARGRDAASEVLVIDVASGCGGPFPDVFGRTAAEREASGTGPNIAFLLTDYFPQSPLWRQNFSRYANISYCVKSVDACAVDLSLIAQHAEGGGADALRKAVLGTSTAAAPTTMLTNHGALHHFTPSFVKRMIATALRDGRSVLFVEPVERTLLHLLLYSVAGPAACFMTLWILFYRLLCGFFGVPSPKYATPTFRQVAVRFFWTCVVPLLPLVVLMDGLISCLRVYSEEEFFEIVGALQAGEMGEDVAALATNEYGWSWKRTQSVKVPLIGAVGRAGSIITYEAHPKRKTA